MQGLLVIDKPAGLTSFAVVKTVRRILQVAKAGHTGTLDPLATGVLPICLGEATKIAGLLSADWKTYRARARLGLETDTYDRQGRVLAERDASGVSREQVEAGLGGLRGPQLQRPPSFSAVHHQGARAYQLARRGEVVELPPRQVTIEELRLLDWQPPELELQVTCSKGTFIRSLVADLGRQLGTGAVLTELRRLRSGCFDLDRAVPLGELAERQGRGELPLISIDQALTHLLAVEIPPDQVTRLRQGQPVPGVCSTEPAGLLRLRCGDTLLALGEHRDGLFRPRRVFLPH